MMRVSRPVSHPISLRALISYKPPLAPLQPKGGFLLISKPYILSEKQDKNQVTVGLQMQAGKPENNPLSQEVVRNYWID